jgi:hypothetical protein
MTLTALDLQSRQARTRQIDGAFDTANLWRSFPRNSGNVVDVREIEDEKIAAQFFVSEVGKVLARESPPGASRGLIVLSAPHSFEKGEDLRPIEASAPRGTRIYYVRCNARIGFDCAACGPSTGPSSAPSFPPAGPYPHPPPPPSGRVSHPPPLQSNSDSLEPTLKPLKPRLFDVTSASDFRSALAVILDELSQLAFQP